MYDTSYWQLATWKKLEFTEFRRCHFLNDAETHMLVEDKYDEIFMIFLRIFVSSCGARNRSDFEPRWK